MYNLLVSGDCDEWDGTPFQIELTRCVREYTDDSITQRYGSLNAAAIADLKRLPCIFACETDCNIPPKFGIIRDIVARQGSVRITYEFEAVSPFLTAEDLTQLSFELDIGKWEMNRTHWAVKDINLAKELQSARNILLPDWTRSRQAVDISTHNFDVALSFPGESRHTVEAIARELEGLIGPDSYFYDNNYMSQLARPSLDRLLQDIYGNRSKLVVVFLSADYQRKDWCGVEFRAISETLMRREHSKIMFVKVGEGSVDGVFQTDGYISADRCTPRQIAQFIEERVKLL